jgi:DNA-binding transcriptional ArsR family regulator
MGVSKTSLFSRNQNKIASIAKVLGHPARIAILQHLIEKNICICGDLVEEIGLAQSTISQHLKELKLAGIIKGNIEGSSVCYCIDQEKWLDIKNTLNQIFEWKSSSCC